MIPHNGGTRGALLYVPRHVRRRGGLPLVLAFHGGASSPESMAERSALHRIAEREGFVVAYPRGTQGKSGLTWVPSGRDRARAVGDSAFVRALVADLQRAYAIDESRVYAVGFSIGGSLVYELACVMGDRLAAVAVVAGTMTTSHFDPVGPVPLLHIHGSSDRRVPFEGGRGPATKATGDWLPVQDCIDQWRTVNSCTGAPTVERLGLRGVTSHTYHGAAVVELWLVEGAGHVWPGAPREPAPGEDAPAPKNDGVANAFSASEKIWTFFAAHARRRARTGTHSPSER